VVLRVLVFRAGVAGGRAPAEVVVASALLGASAGDASSPALALRIELKRRWPVRLLSAMVEDLRQQLVDLGGGVGAALTRLEDAAALQCTVAMNRATPNAGRRYR
jgi:hypothetical protein